ncbi:hypothetical protein DYB28_015230 [Aphanomyces astaci]|nr:hypothetical protein DYB28_015230 [Aphanomyces astaci]
MGNGTSSAAVGDDSRSKAYMDLIRMQDEQLEALRDQVTHLTTRGATSSCQATKNPLADDLAAAHNLIADLKLAQDRNETRIRGLTTANDLRKDAALKKLLHAEAATTTLEMAPPLTDLSKGLHRSEEQELRVDQLENDVRRLTRQLQQKEDALDAARATIDMLSAHQAIAVDNSHDVEPPQEVLMLVGSLEIQCRSFRDVLEQVLGPEGVSKALQLSQDRGAVPFWSSSC